MSMVMATCLLILINKVSFDLVANVSFFYSGYFIFTGDENATKQYEWMCSLSLAILAILKKLIGVSSQRRRLYFKKKCLKTKRCLLVLFVVRWFIIFNNLKLFFCEIFGHIGMV